MKDLKEKLKASLILKIIIWAVVILIPLMYSFFYLKAFWDPYGNLQNVKVGVVNLDEGVENENQGKKLQDKLLEKDTLKFEKVEEENANTSLINQEYYALITIPKDFTKNLKNAENADRQITTITYSPNKKSNYLASQIINSAVNTIEKEVRSEISETVVGTLTDKLNEVPEKMQEISNGAEQLQEGTQTLSNKYQEFDNGINTAYNGSKSLDEGLAELNKGINELYAGTEKLENGTQDVETLIASVNELAQSYKQLNDGIQQYVTTVNSIPGMNSQLTATGTVLANNSSKINSGIQTLNSEVSKLNQLSSGVKQLNNGAKQLQNGGAQLKAGSSDLTSGIETLSSSSKQVQDGIGKINEGVTELKTGVDDGIADTKEQLTKLEGLDEYTANPIKIEEKSYGQIEKYGVAFAPYFISLSLWVGALMAFVVLYYDQENRFKLFGKYAENKILRTALYGGLAVIQGIALGFLLKLGLGFNVTNIWLYYGTCILTAVLFLNIIEFLIVTFGDIGKFIALILLILQLAATGGTFPIETVPTPFQNIHSFLPMTYTIRLLREALVCIDGNLLTKNITILLILTVVFIGINALNDIIRKKRNITDK